MKIYTLLLFLGLTGTLNAQTLHLAVPDIKNYTNRTKWCAAAAAECVLKYNQINIGQCDIMNHVRSLDPSVYGGHPCCLDIPNFSQHPCDKGINLGFNNEKVSVKNILMHFGNIASRTHWQINPNAIYDDLTKNHPPIAQWNYWDWRGAHAVVICGIENWQVYYMDPADGRKYDDSWYNFLSNDEFFWLGTLRCEECTTRGYPCHCFNGERDEDEEGIDCGGANCLPCTPCNNCILDEGEEAIDCGGPNCPDCKYVGDVTDELTITNTADLRTEMRAFKKITAGGDTKVASGKEVNFITKKTGSIVLRPGFTAEHGSEFKTQMKDLSEYERLCGAICYDYTLPDALTNPSDELYIYNLLYALEFRCDIFNSSGKHIFSNIRTIKSDGDFYIWDCLDGVYDGYNVPTGRHDFKMEYTISYCNGAANFSGREHNFSVTYVYDKSLNEEPEKPETPPQFPPSNPNNIPLHSATAPPQFTITPNPNPGTFQLQTNFPFTDIAHLKIITSIGATLYETQTLSSHTIQLPTSATGQHFVVIMLKDGNMLTQKMVIQR